MSRLRAFSSPDLVPSDSGSVTSPTRTTEHQSHETSGLEGISTNVKLLLKLVQDHNEANTKQRDEWKAQRVNTMMAILDDLKTRILKAQQQSSSSGKKELRRCNTELKPRQDLNRSPTKPPLNDPDDVQKLRKELSASMAARKSLQMMCSSLGKEKEIMAIELSRKAYELTEMEELISDLKAQNEKLLKKVQNCAVEHKKEDGDGKGGGGDKDMPLQGRNKELSEQLLKSIDGYRSLKRRYKEVQEENGIMRQVLKDSAEEVNAGAQRLMELHEKATREDELDLEKEISELEKLFQEIGLKISNHSQIK
ncbi:hypothetical protein IGI04_033081 [Brassica rapa subsp. trilocularis]|uniref:Uncharacterized protein n=2 Tax=Brassica campestris TaxID=3711 RepID=M4EZI2_BRACM|nr:centrosome-associated protein CEP250 [Brassica rapa]KAG5381455.1 hypothetical protein IGI04_032925 [Brassica rapa subsp. trilocularis]KAG5381611.1 hypothetical protein IGI04_033081 [Brassica rapa subsp. trilocularis]